MVKLNFVPSQQKALVCEDVLCLPCSKTGSCFRLKTPNRTAQIVKGLLRSWWVPYKTDLVKEILCVIELDKIKRELLVTYFSKTFQLLKFRLTH